MKETLITYYRKYELASLTAIPNLTDVAISCYVTKTEELNKS